jgi:hypothetical protein
LRDGCTETSTTIGTVSALVTVTGMLVLDAVTSTPPPCTTFTLSSSAAEEAR